MSTRSRAKPWFRETLLERARRLRDTDLAFFDSPEWGTMAEFRAREDAAELAWRTRVYNMVA